MRLKNIYNILKEVEPVFMGFKTVKIPNSDIYTISEWTQIIEAIEKINNIDLFKVHVKELFNITPIFGDKSQELKISSSQHTSLVGWIAKTQNMVKTSIALCESVGYDFNDTGFEIKLPETSIFDDFSSNIGELNRVIKLCPFIRSEDSQISLQKTDIGSTWLVFTIIGASVLVLKSLGAFAQSALKIKSMYQTCELQKEAVRGARVKNDLAQEITDTYIKIIKATASKEVEELEIKLEKTLSEEERTGAEISLDILGKLMSKGLEIYAALDASQEAKDVFPNIDDQKLLPEMIKLLTGKADI